MASSQLRLAGIGAGAGLSGLLLESAISEDSTSQSLFAPIVGGAIGAASINASFHERGRFRPGWAVLLLGAIAGLSGSYLSKRLMPNLAEPTTTKPRIVLAGLTGAAFGGAGSMLSASAFMPPEFSVSEKG